MKKNIVFLAELVIAASLIWASLQWYSIDTNVEIGAAPERVWEVLTDADRYPEWNPVIVRLEGELKAGETIEFENRSGNSSMVFRPKVLTATPAKELRWLGRLWVPGLFDGEHAFVLDEVRAGVTHLHHGERFRGLLVPFSRGWLRGSVHGDFTHINAALKERAEQGTSAGCTGLGSGNHCPGGRVWYWGILPPLGGLPKINEDLAC